MSSVGGQKLKILRIYQILLECSDEENPMNATDIIEELKKYDIPAERKSIYKDIDTLMEAGIDIVKVPAGYYIAERVFELPELKLLVDAVGASKFISKKKSQALLAKIESLASKSQAHTLSRQVIVPDRVKTDNEKSFYTIDAIYQCIEEDKQLLFQYEEWTVNKTKSLRRNGEFYQVSPAFLLRNDENYYLVAYDENNQEIRHYRVDKIVNARVSEEERGGKDYRNSLNPEEYAKKHVSMFTGDETVVTISLDERLVGVVLDKFGQDISIRSDSPGQIRARLSVAISPQFYGWVTGLGARIVAPEIEAEKYKKYLLSILNE